MLTGSHMDSQPTGGRFDGMYGVLAAFEALEALEDADVKTKRPVVAVAWTNEEGSRFQPGAMGSAVFAGHYTLDDMLAAKDWDGVVLKDALASTLKAAPAPPSAGKPGFALDGYVEAHIEQGPRLENERKTIGVVTGIQGSRRYIVETAGEEAHAGTTPPTTRCASPSAAWTCSPARPTPCRARPPSPSTCAIRRMPYWTRTKRSSRRSWPAVPRRAPPRSIA